MKPSDLRVMHTRDFSRRLGITSDRVRRGATRWTLRVGSRHLNPYGFLHGGVTATLVDTAMGTAVASTLGPGEQCAAVGLQMDYVESVRNGRLVAKGRVLRRGRRLAHTRCEVKTEKGRLVALATGSFYIFAAWEGDKNG